MRGAGARAGRIAGMGARRGAGGVIRRLAYRRGVRASLRVRLPLAQVRLEPLEVAAHRGQMRVLSRGCHIVDVLRLRDDLPRLAVAVLEFLQKQEASGVVFLREVLHHAQVGGNGEHEAESHASDRLPIGVLDDEIRLLLLRERGNGREVIEAVDAEKDAAHELIVLLVLHIRHLRFDGLQLVDVDLIDGIEVQRGL